MLGIFSHRFHRSTQIVWVRRFSHRFHGIHRNSCGGYSPTDFTDLHRLFGCVESPTDCTDLHRLFGCLQGGALVSSAPTELRWCTSCYVGALETSAPPEVSSFCVNLCNLWEAPLCKKFCADPCNLWEAFCCCGGKDTSATIFRSLTICVDPCNLWENHSARSSVKSAYSVGGSTVCLVGALETSAPPEIEICGRIVAKVV